MGNRGRNILIIAILVVCVIVIAMFMSLLKGFLAIQEKSNDRDRNSAELNTLMNL